MGKRIYLLPIACLLLLNIFVWREVFDLAQEQYLQVNILGIGQGDAIFITTPAMHQILIDGGPNANVLGRLQNMMPFWDRSLDVVVLTHPDADHLAGLLHVLQKYKIEYVVWTGIARDGQMYEQWLTLLQEVQKRGTQIVIAKSGQQIKSGDALITTLNPVEDLVGQYFKSTSNETGIVMRLAFRKSSFLFTADIGVKTEKALVDLATQTGNSVYLDADVLKVAHHGSRFSTSEEFLQAVRPGLAVISVGKDNTYGHPTPEVLQRLEKFGISVLRTDQSGTIEILSDGENINIK